MEKVKKFYEKAMADVNLQDKLKGFKGLEKEKAIEAIIALAKENGFEFSKEDHLAFSNVQKGAGELNEADLDAVAGGGAGTVVTTVVTSIQYCKSAISWIGGWF